MMFCDRCKTGQTDVLDSKPASDGSYVRRRRRCMSCEFRFTTYERIEEVPLPKIIKRDGSREAFSYERLEESMYNACSKLPIERVRLDHEVGVIHNQVGHYCHGDIPIDTLCLWIAESLGELHEIARVRFEMEYLRPQDAADCLEVIMMAFNRALDKIRP